MDALTRSSSTGMRNDAARGSLLCALLGLALPVAAFAAARQLNRVSLLHATAATCGSVVLGLAAIGLSRRARRNLDYTLGRAGGRGAARAGKVLGVLAVCIGCAAALALGFYGLLRYFG
jgi:hypothetical protein